MFYVTGCSNLNEDTQIEHSLEEEESSRSILFGRHGTGGNGTSHGLSNSCGHKHGKNNSAH